ncbi:hypothetical protein Thiowin_02051 [Thiorhodovibrio winogradskyi]|uniref:Uncharacterized protein n=1 Tax=Thiorhodovibrio winogradskyi TaxID=77007 RepID=A0ABZ0SBT7_9GAMM
MKAEQDRLRLCFELLLDKPRSMAIGRFSYAIADPTFYIEILHEDGADAFPPACRVQVQAPA